ncbi:hypothetical protein ACFOGG_18300 [Brenneria rubrifaciens]|uniref:hypothetical protein n=1 Tax=Brenneria rubrifaciens TaxID=55213 RepID=UPI00360BA0B2
MPVVKFDTGLQGWLIRDFSWTRRARRCISKRFSCDFHNEFSLTRSTESDNVFYTNKSNNTAAYCFQPTFSLPLLRVAGTIMRVTYAGTDVISSIKEEVRYV